VGGSDYCTANKVLSSVVGTLNEVEMKMNKKEKIGSELLPQVDIKRIIMIGIQERPFERVVFERECVEWSGVLSTSTTAVLGCPECVCV
jgi:hypothetical protein